MSHRTQAMGAGSGTEKRGFLCGIGKREGKSREEAMSVVIVGGHDRMVSQYVRICKSFNCKAKVFTQMTADFGKQIGAPDLLVLFTNTVSHKMIRTAVDGARGTDTRIVRCHSSSKTALEEILQKQCAAG